MLDRKQITGLALIAVTAVLLYLCYRLALPFLPALAWALALAVAAYPLHKRIERKIKNRSLAAAASVSLLAIAVVVPIIFVGREIVREASRNAAGLRREIETGELRTQVEQNERLAPWLHWLEAEVDVRGTAASLAEKVPELASSFLTASGWFVVELFIGFFALFYFFRDHDELLRGVRRLVPLSEAEILKVFKRAEETIYAVVYGVLVVAIVQGTLVGLMFWILGLRAPALWGLAMAVLSVLPFVAGWMIWVPAAVYLALTGSYIKAAILLGWGIAAVLLIENWLYPMLVGDRLRLHTLLMVVALLGGLLLFGVAGVVLGPLTLVLTITLLEIGRERTTGGAAFEKDVSQT
jgi:predicted PurR-regulated permease PerM